MEQIDNHCHHQFERQRHQPHVCSIPHDEHISTVALQSLDTVRALHQTVVSLRKALEEAHHEIDTLKKQITINVDIEEGKKYRRQEHIKSNERLNKSETNVAAKTTIDDFNKSLINNSDTLQTFRSDSVLHKSQKQSNDSIDKGEHRTSLVNLSEQEATKARNRKAKTSKATNAAQQIHEFHTTKVIVKPSKKDDESSVVDQRFRQMASKIDVKIKLSSNFKIDGSDDTSSATTADSSSGNNCFLNNKKLSNS